MTLYAAQEAQVELEVSKSNAMAVGGSTRLYSLWAMNTAKKKSYGKRCSRRC